MRRAALLLVAALAPALAGAQPAPGDVAAAIAAIQTERLRPLDFAPFAAALAGFRPSPGLDAFLTGADIAAVRSAMAAGDLSSETLLLWHIDRIRRLDDRLRGMLELNPAALEDARAADARRAAGTALGPMDGITVSLKDNIETAGPMHTTANAEILLHNVAARDAPLVAALRAAGAVIVGKASLSELAGVVAPGTPSGGGGAVGGQGVNPLGPYATTGSSSGSAIGVAAGYALASVGTETSGSLVAPAGMMSLVAMKPSEGLVSTEGVVPLIRSNDSAGPVAQSVRDAATLLAAMDTADADYAAGLSPGALAGVRVGVLARDIAAKGGTGDALARAVAALDRLGAETRPVEAGQPDGGVGLIFLYLGSGMRTDMMPYVAARNPAAATLEDLIAYNRADPRRRIPFGQSLLERLAPVAREFTPGDHADLAALARREMTAALDAAFAAGGGVTLLVSMANLHSPLYATAGYPAITVPVGRNASGEPLGVTLIARKGQDAQLLAAAHAFEQATRARIRADLP